MNLQHNGLFVSEIRVVLCNREGKVKARVWLVLNDSLKIPGVRVIETRRGGYVVAMPSRRAGNGVFVDTLHPIDGAAREWFNAIVLDAYHDERRRAFEAAVESALAEAAVEPFSTELREAV